MDVNKYGPWALVIGGSEGVGAAFVRKLAIAGFGTLACAIDRM
jgi:NAD(P)-dependent dehydrogenase (short-subunit alcohol dehydrogenase family)